MNQDCTTELIIKTLGIIEKGIEEKCNGNEIKRRIIDEIGYNYNYFNELFKNVIGCSIANYIRFASYSIWKTEKPELKQRDSYVGLDYFLYNFKRTFGRSITEVETKGINEMENISKEELIKITEFLEEIPLIESYKFEKRSVEFTVDIDMVLVFMLSNKCYFISKDVIDNTNWKDMNEDSKKMLLILFNRAPDEFDEENQIILKEEEIEQEYMVIDSYNMDEPELFNDYYIFYYKWDAQLKPIVERNIDSLFSRMEIIISGKDIPRKYNNILQVFKECKGLITISRIALKCKMAETDILEILWDMAQKGFLRITN
ncbi:MAG: AraC family transcriptional regulator [Lachnospiraceae bacterium]|nr:AraC family transcriptional regulator [Lachnospiraceae bacterium]